MAGPRGDLDREHPHVAAFIAVVFGLLAVAVCVWQMTKHWLFPDWRIGGANGLTVNQVVFGFLAISAGLGVLVNLVRLVVPVPDSKLPRVSVRGRIVGTMGSELRPPDWGPGVFLASKRTLDFVTNARVRHSLGTWANAFSWYSASSTDRGITLWLRDEWHLIELEPGEDFDLWLQMIREHHVKEGAPPSIQAIAEAVKGDDNDE